MNSLVGFAIGLFQATLSFFGLVPHAELAMDTQAQPSSVSEVVKSGNTVDAPQFCPVLSANVAKGSKDEQQVPEWAHGDVGALQIFLAQKYKLDQKTFVDGIFGANTETYLMKFQKEEGLPQSGTADNATRAKILSLCTQDATVNNKEFAKRKVQFKADSFDISVKQHESIQDSQGTLEQGAFRIELLAVEGSAKLRVTGRVINGIQSEIIVLKPGEKKLSGNWPVGLLITLKELNTSGATLTIAGQSTD